MKLDELVPAILPKLPVDLYHAQPFIYERIDNGYLLYTTGGNGKDDGGSNEQMSTFEGHSLDDLDESEAETARQTLPKAPTTSPSASHAHRSSCRNQQCPDRGQAVADSQEFDPCRTNWNSAKFRYNRG